MGTPVPFAVVLTEAVHHLPCEAASVPEARRLASEVAINFLDESQFHSFGLAVTEIVSNAVRHAGDAADDIRLAVTPKDGYMCVQVTDSGPGLVPRPGALEAGVATGVGAPRAMPIPISVNAGRRMSSRWPAECIQAFTIEPGVDFLPTPYAMFSPTDADTPRE